DICLDEFLGRTKAPAITVKPIQQATKKVTPRGQTAPVIQHASHIPKPQLAFKRKVENNDLPWYPSLPHKYNAKVPLGYDLRDSQEDSVSPISLHPYRYEITHINYPERMFRPAEPCPPKEFSDTPFTWISTPQDLQTLLAKLRQASEIAIDLEHHDYRTYAGFLCLMQISTREEDFIIDTLALRDELAELNEAFTNPNIVKVMIFHAVFDTFIDCKAQVLHGAESDIVWLQQNFDLYIVNLFDTFHASKALGDYYFFAIGVFADICKQNFQDMDSPIFWKCIVTFPPINVTN
ncbi:hypothetical protein H0H93_014253, partial [Arthromyces matolae]